MADSKSFEDQFDHDPNAVYEEEDADLDLGPDDEFADTQPSPSAQREKRPHSPAVPKGGCFGGLLKVVLSLSLIVFCYFYLFKPEKFTAIQTKITDLVSAEKDAEAPVLSLGGTDRPVLEFSGISTPQQKVSVPSVILHGSGILSDFTTAAKQKPSLNSYLISADGITFETLDMHHNLVKNMIADWAGETDEQKISEILQMPYKTFFNRTSASLLSQTLLKRLGLTPVNTDQMISQSPVHIMAAVYPKLKSAMAVKKTVQEQIRTIEPISSFLIYICHDNSECMASWDLLIDMLGVKQFAKRKEKAPETIYTGK